jgi:hypothetical protein
MNTFGFFNATDERAVLQAAADEIWHSMQKYSGNPTHQNNHPINCGCTYCD